MIIETDPTGKTFFIDDHNYIRLYHPNGPEKFTVLELHRYLQGMADNATQSGDELVSITSDNPSVRYTDKLIEVLPPWKVSEEVVHQINSGTIYCNDGMIYSAEVIYHV